MNRIAYYVIAVSVACITMGYSALFYNQEQKTVGTQTIITAPDAKLDSGTIPKQAQQLLAKYPISFELNRGQTDKQVEYLFRGNGYTLFLTPSEAVFSFQSKSSIPSGISGITQDTVSATQNSTSAAVFSMQFVNSQPAKNIEGINEIPGKRHYFIGDDAAHWHTNIPAFAKVRYREIYPGIDLEYYGKESRLEYDFIVAPNVDPSVIRIAFEGAGDINLNQNGDLVIKTGAGELIQHAPFIYQDIGGVRREVAGHYVLLSDEHNGQHNTPQVVFHIASYDSERTLVIDPGLTYSTYLGGGGADEGNAITVDSSGNFYVAGGTSSLNFPGDNSARAPHVSNDCLQAILNCDSDAFVSKFNAFGELVFSTYLGSDNFLGDNAKGIAVSATGKIFVTGYTHEGFTAFPTTMSFTFPRGQIDVFVSALSNDGSQLLYSVLVGGAGADVGEGITVDASGDVYVTGYTYSDQTTLKSGLPAPFPTVNAAYTAGDNTSNLADVFVLKISPDGNDNGDLIYSTYLGGAGQDEGYGIAVDPSGNAIVTGRTSSSDFPIFGGIQTGLNGTDAFVAKLNTVGDTLVYSTYLGGGGTDTGRGVATDGSGNAYVTGETASTDFPLSTFRYDGTLSGNSDSFVIKFSSTGTMVYSTYLGGSSDEVGNGIAVDSAGNAYLTGYTSSSDFPVEVSNLINTSVTFKGGASDTYITKLGPAGTALSYSTYYGGSGDDRGRGITVDSAGTTAYVTGWTSSVNSFSLASTAAQSTPGGGSRDAFVARIGPFADLSIVINDNDPVPLGGTLAYSIVVTNNGPDTATGIVLTAVLPSIGDAIYVSDDAGCTHNAGIVTCNLSNLASGSNTAVQINVTLNTQITVTATASVTGSEADYPANNSDSEQTTASQPDSGGDDDSQNTANPNDPTGPFIIITNPVSNAGGGGAVNIVGLTVLLLLLGMRLVMLRRYQE